jgi:hypothetical protein
MYGALCFPLVGLTGDRYLVRMNRRRLFRNSRWLTGLATGLWLGTIVAGFTFPIGVWLQDPTNAVRYRATGINTYVGLWQGPTAQQLSELQAHGLRVICSQNETALRHPAATNIIAWMHNDEPDNSPTRGARFGFGSPVPPERIQADYQRMKTTDPTRPVFLNLGQGVAWDGWYGRGRRNNYPEDYPEYLKGCDLASFDIYPANHPAVEVAGNLWFVADGITRLRKWSNDTKPIWNCIETTRIDKDGRKPTPSEVRAQVWMSLIHGSQGIIYFVHQFQPTFVEAALLADAEMRAAVTSLNHQIAALAPVLYSPTLRDAVLVQATNTAVPIATMTKQHDGFTYLFAVAMRPGTNTASFRLTSVALDQAVEVIGENRTLAMKEGVFSDRFGPWEVHLYRVASGAVR